MAGNPTNAVKSTMSDAWKAIMVYGALADSSGTEMTGGSPAYARIAESWGSSTNGVVSDTQQTFNIASGSTPARKQFYTASSGGSVLDWIGITSQLFSSQGTYAVTSTYTYTE